MNVAILAPSHTPFVMGGAEHLWLGLQRFVIEETTHACELIKVPTREGSLPEILQSYRRMAGIDLAHFDRIITTKYPAWMTRHDNHAVYLQHTLRGLYDTYHFCGQPEQVLWPAELRSVRDAIEGLGSAEPGSNGALERLLDTLEQALGSGHIDPAFARFPGPFSRLVVQALDHFGLQPARIAQYTAISNTVRRRAGYFPPGADVAVLHHPPRLEAFRCAGDDHLFTISRLDGAKRIGLIVEAMRYVKADIPLLIGGVGPDEPRLRELAAGDSRIRFLGAMNDADVLDAYAHALAVPFVPYDEDLGLVMIEAMRSGKPVITVTDAGGVTEFVEHGHTGLCVAPEPIEIAHAIDQLCQDRAGARQMGVQARRRVAGVTWHAVAERLLGVPLQRRAPQVHRRTAPAASRPSIAVALSFAVDPPRGGGQSRIFHLYSALAEHIDVTLVCLTGPEESHRRREIAPGLVEVRVPKTAAHQHAETEASRHVDWVPITDIVAARQVHLTPLFLEALDAACAGADALVASHPYFVRTLRERHPGKPLWFEAHNVEFLLKKDMLPQSPAADALLDMVRQDEQQAWREASVVLACARRDLEVLERLYGPTAARTLEVPNGYAEGEVRRVDTATRRRLKRELELGDTPLALFLGSWHGPNLEAVERILGYARTFSGINFVVVGSACLYFENRDMPMNVHMVGVVDEAEKQVFLGAADLALNPMTTGSGSNLKMLDYFAAGIPVLSTHFGARGIEAEPGLHYLSCEVEDFEFQLLRWLVEPQALGAMADRAEELVRKHYSWRAIGAQASRFLLAHIFQP